MRSQMTQTDNDPKASCTAKTTAPMTRSLLSSPPRVPSSQAKERRKSSLTPRKFQRFFTPRSRVSNQPTSASGRALRDLTASALNRCPTSSSPLRSISEDALSDDVASVASARASKRRKMQHTPETSPLRPKSTWNSSPVFSDTQASPSRRRQLLSPIRSLQASPSSQDAADSEDRMSDDDLPSLSAPVTRTVTLPSRGMAAQLVQRMTGGMPRGGHQLLRCPVADWRTEVADFYSQPEDVHRCPSNEGPGHCIPFSVANCNTNSLIGVGDEEGYIRLLDTSKEFNKVHLSFQAHNNAIIDFAFSEDDGLVATASGDQKGKVFDMPTQTPISVLSHHTASLKQVRFQPGRGSSSVLATSSRDGSIQIWDLRCRGAAPVHEILDRRPTALGYRAPQKINSGCVVNSIYGAHAPPPLHRYQTRQNHGLLHLSSSSSLPSSSSPATASSTDICSRGEVPGRAGDVSVTAIHFLPPGQEHLLLSASEANATVKLWDIRHIQTGGRSHKTPLPVSHTRQPDSHLAFRPFGISALALGRDGARLYAVCKDNTVYAYSTAHLVLGHAPELSPTAGSEPPRRPSPGAGAGGGGGAAGGLGPLYGFRHPSFHATSFYIKAAVRPARDGRPEMLAVGSSDGSPVLFPTDERYFRRDLGAGFAAPPNGVDGRSAAAGGGKAANLAASTTGVRSSSPAIMMDTSSNNSTASGRRGHQRGGGGRQQRPGPGPGRGLVRANSITNLSARLADSIPVFRPYGAALVRGHDKEVGALAWTHDGARLVTVGDDYAVRCWAEDRGRAADLRTGGEINGRRWACGWADVGEDWEGDGDDW